MSCSAVSFTLCIITSVLCYFIHVFNPLHAEYPFTVCPQTEENVDMLPCPTPDSWNRIHCIDYFSLCDRKVHCPKGEDEDPTMCLFHTAADAYMNKMVRSMYRLFDKTQEATHTPTYLTYSYRRK